MGTKTVGGFVQVETNPQVACGDGSGQSSHLAGRRQLRGDGVTAVEPEAGNDPDSAGIEDGVDHD